MCVGGKAGLRLMVSSASDGCLVGRITTL